MEFNQILTQYQELYERELLKAEEARARYTIETQLIAKLSEQGQKKRQVQNLQIAEECLSLIAAKKQDIDKLLAHIDENHAVLSQKIRLIEMVFYGESESAVGQSSDGRVSEGKNTQTQAAGSDRNTAVAGNGSSSQPTAFALPHGETIKEELNRLYKAARSLAKEYKGKEGKGTEDNSCRKRVLDQQEALDKLEDQFEILLGEVRAQRYKAICAALQGLEARVQALHERGQKLLQELEVALASLRIK